jgi:hypothetical protein
VTNIIGLACNRTTGGVVFIGLMPGVLVVATFVTGFSEFGDV